MFGCSRRTIERRLCEFGITSHEFTSISDRELDQVIAILFRYIHIVAESESAATVISKK